MNFTEAEIVDTAGTEIVEYNPNNSLIEKDAIDPKEVIRLDMVVEDYSKLRNVILDNVAQLKTLSNNIIQDLEIDGYNPDLVQAFNGLVETSNKSLKILTDSYKSISDILINIAKINDLHKSKKKDPIEGEIITTQDIIKRLQSAQN